MKKGEGGLAVVGTIGVVLFVGIISLLIMGVDTVDANHLGVKVKLGKITGIQEPGMEWTGLFTQVYQYDRKIRKVKVDMMDEASSAVDSTGQFVFGSVSVNYRLVADKQVVMRLYQNVGRNNVIEDVLNLRPIIKEGFKQATVQYEAIEILQKRQEVKELAKENIKNNFPGEYFEIVDIVVEDIDFSAGFKKAIEDKKIATQNKLKEQEQVEVVRFQQLQEIEISKAQAEKARLQYVADTEQLRLQKEQITPMMIQKLWIEKWDGSVPLYMISSEDNLNTLLQLPQMQVTVGE